MTGNVFGVPCTHKETSPDVVTFLEFSPLTECFRFDSPSRMSGIWLHEFEGSKFIQNATRPPAAWRWTGNDTELQPAGIAERQLQNIESTPQRRAFRITFVGRAMLFGFEHAYGTDRYIAIDRVLSIQEVATPTKTEFCMNGPCRPKP